MKKVLTGLALIILLFAVSGCISYSEETWLNDNGSGKLKMEIGVNESLMNMAAKEGNGDPFSEDKIKSSFKNNKNVKIINAKSYNKDGNRVLQMVLEFKSFKSLEASMNNKNSSSNPGFIGHITMTKNKKGQIVFDRVLALNSPSSSEKKSDDAAIGEMMNGLLANYVWKYTVHFPYKVISANTADEYIDHKTNTVRWDFALTSLAKKPQKMRAVLRPYNFFEAILHTLNLYN